MADFLLKTTIRGPTNHQIGLQSLRASLRIFCNVVHVLPCFSVKNDHSGTLKPPNWAPEPKGFPKEFPVCFAFFAIFGIARITVFGQNDHFGTPKLQA